MSLNGGGIPRLRHNRGMLRDLRSQFKNAGGKWLRLVIRYLRSEKVARYEKKALWKTGGVVVIEV
jgi:hypothetical protein